MRNRVALSSALALMLAPGCSTASQDGAPDTGDSSEESESAGGSEADGEAGSTAGTTTGPCDGLEGCPCLDGMTCGFGLLCIDAICEVDTGSTSAATSGDGDGSGTTGDGDMCMSSAECDADQWCWAVYDQTTQMLEPFECKADCVPTNDPAVTDPAIDPAESHWCTPGSCCAADAACDEYGYCSTVGGDGDGDGDGDGALTARRAHEAYRGSVFAARAPKD